MNDKNKQLEMEIQRLKLENKKMILERSIKIQNSVSSSINSTKKIINHIFKFIFYIFSGLLTGLFLWLAFGVFFLFTGKYTSPSGGDIIYRLGYVYGAMPDWSLPAALLVSVIYLLIEMYK